MTGGCGFAADGGRSGSLRYWWPPPSSAPAGRSCSNPASPLLEIGAFLIGLFPEGGLQVLKLGTNKSVVVVAPQVHSAFRLRQLDGMNIWREARLQEEGIEDIQNLVTASLSDLLLRVRMPAHRLVDWIDQGFLLLHLPRVKLERPAAAGASPGEQTRSARENLRVMGIRTATDFERAWDEHGTDSGFCVEIGRALGVGEESGRAIAASIVTALEGEPNLRHVREYRKVRSPARRSSPGRWRAPGSPPAELPRHLATG
jgi:hypothetical protein